jgi:acetyl-CoA C-acetyltransferase
MSSLTAHSEDSPVEDAYIVAAVRTPIGRRGGGLAGVHPADLAALALRGVVEQSQIDPDRIEDVILGCVGQLGAQTLNIARTAALSAGLPEHVPGVTVDRQCGSSQQAVHFAAQAVQSGNQHAVIAGGVEMMSVVPMGSTRRLGAENGMGAPFEGVGWHERYGGVEISQFRGAELIAERWGIKRQDMEQFALESHRRAGAAWDSGAFDDEVVEVAGVTRDEGPRPDTSLEKMAALKPLTEGGTLTAAVSSQISDAAAALLIVSGSMINELGLSPLARIHAMSVVGSDPELMLTGPIPATRQVLERVGMSLGDIDVFEVNEAFAPVVLAWAKELDVHLERVNPLGGAIALGHPIGATGARIMTTMVHHLHRQGLRFGLQAICEGGGTANATIVEAV